jgi:formamidopyrimidine-DNA glycosylase
MSFFMASAYAAPSRAPTDGDQPLPELPEVEIACRNLGRWTEGRLIIRVETPDTARFEGDGAALEGARVLRWRRVGKYLVADLEGDRSVLSHLGMTGQWVANAPPDRSHQRVILHFEGPGPERISLVDPRRFGWTWILATADVKGHPRLSGLGPDPLGPTFSVQALRSAVGGGRSALKTRLMNQRVLAGLGNIAISEIGWRAAIHPHRTCASLRDDQWARLHGAIMDHLRFVLDAEESEEIVYLGYAGAVNPFLCYGREGAPCSRCQTPIARAALAKRATFYCPSCQES